ncbi:hypothetical protein Cmtc_14340 [Cupriavidus sp. TKC]|nr:hypothetical protein Cmtc_14340 [Cupriavidus sp. TKC]
MARRFLYLNIGFAGFCIAAMGAITGFIGFGIETRWLSLLGFGITIFGVLVGFIGIVLGWITIGGQAISGSVSAANELAARIKRFRK